MSALTSKLRTAFGAKARPDSGQLSFEQSAGSNPEYKKDEQVVEGDSTVRDDGLLSFDEATKGGLGRHLGFWSTYFLM